MFFFGLTFDFENIIRVSELASYFYLKPSSLEVVGAMDEISDTLFSVLVIANLCCSTYPNRKFIKDAHAAHARMEYYILKVH